MSCRLPQPLTYESFYVNYLSCEMCRGNVNATSRGYYIMSGACSLHEPAIEVRWPKPHAALVVLGGEHDLNSADQLRETFNQSLAHCDHLIVDLSATGFIDASTIGVLMEARQHAIELDRTFSVVQAVPQLAIVDPGAGMQGATVTVNLVGSYTGFNATTVFDFGKENNRSDGTDIGAVEGRLVPPPAAGGPPSPSAPNAPHRSRCKKKKHGRKSAAAAKKCKKRKKK